MKLLKKILKRKLLTITIIGFVLFAWVISYYIFNNVNNDNQVALASVEKFNLELSANKELPVRLKIPKINVNSNIEYVGLTEEGVMDVPQGPSNVAWYNLGVLPGEIGSAVVAGHSGWKDGIHAAFDELQKIKKDDRIYVENSKGGVNVFIVRQIKSLAFDADASEIFFSKDGLSHLNLITCNGAWNDIEESHPSRLIIFTDLEI